MVDKVVNLPVVTPQSLGARPASTNRGATQQDKAPEKFEAMLLGVLFEQALPKGDAIFGKGLAGNVARSQLGQQLAHALASNGALGIGALVRNANDPAKRS